MPAFAGIIFAVAWLLLAASACSIRTPTPNCVAGREQCTCRDGACDDGLSCVSGMCFDIGELGSKESSSTKEPQANQGTRRQGQSSNAQRSSGGSTSQRSDAGPSAGEAAGAGGRAADAGPVRDAAASAAADSSMAEAAGGDSAACAAPGTSCADMLCCQGTSCINNTCRILCLGNSDCTSGCCMPFDATRSVCAEREQCAAAPAGQGGSSGAAGTASRGGSGGAAADSCSAAGAECGAQGCCDGVACVNNICAAACSSEQECASACCLSFFAGAEKVCVPSTLCRRL